MATKNKTAHPKEGLPDAWGSFSSICYKYKVWRWGIPQRRG
jgi:hypothetical protein